MASVRPALLLPAVGGELRLQGTLHTQSELCRPRDTPGLLGFRRSGGPAEGQVSFDMSERPRPAPAILTESSLCPSDLISAYIVCMLPRMYRLFVLVHVFLYERFL